jgi:ankyrin repeat protein
MYAVNIGNLEAVTLLLEAGADVGVMDHMGYTAISLTADPQVQVRLLLRTCCSGASFSI